MRFDLKGIAEKARSRVELQNKSTELAESLPHHLDLAYLTAKSRKFATHWVARSQDSDITKDCFYRLYWSEYEGDYVIQNDDNQLIPLNDHMIGEFVTLQGSDQWWFHVEGVWRKEWQQTDAYNAMMTRVIQEIKYGVRS